MQHGDLLGRARAGEPVLAFNCLTGWKLLGDALSPESRRELEEIRREIKGKHATYGPRNEAEVTAMRDHHQGWPG
jgi:hypothetical protein